MKKSLFVFNFTQKDFEYFYLSGWQVSLMVMWLLQCYKDFLISPTTIHFQIWIFNLKELIENIETFPSQKVDFSNSYHPQRETNNIIFSNNSNHNFCWWNKTTCVIADVVYANSILAKRWICRTICNRWHQILGLILSKIIAIYWTKIRSIHLKSQISKSSNVAMVFMLWCAEFVKKPSFYIFPQNLVKMPYFVSL